MRPRSFIARAPLAAAGTLALVRSGESVAQAPAQAPPKFQPEDAQNSIGLTCMRVIVR